MANQKWRYRLIYWGGILLIAAGILFVRFFGDRLFPPPQPAAEPTEVAAAPTQSLATAPPLDIPTATATATPGATMTPASGETASVRSETPPASSGTPQPASRAGTPTVTATPSATPTYVIITTTPVPENLLTVVPLAQTATARGGTIGTPTPLPANWVTPIILPKTPTPGSAATATFVAALSTAQATLYGTPTPVPVNAWTATPAPATPTPTSVPLLIPYDEITPAPTGIPAPTATPTPTALPAVLTDRIAFLSDRLGDPTVFVMDPDGSNVALLTDEWIYERALEQDATSPSGTQRAFIKSNRGGYELWIENTADDFTWFLTGRQRTVYQPTWSPDSRHIAFVSPISDNDEIYVIDHRTQDETRLTNNDWQWDKHPSWSPDGKEIAFWSNRVTGRRQIWVMDATGENPRNISSNPFNDWNPVWIK